MRKNIIKLLSLAAPALLTLGMASCDDELDDELFTKYTYLIQNGWQEDLVMNIEDDNTVHHNIYFGVNGTSGNNQDIGLTLATDPDTLASFNFDKNKNDSDAYYSILPQDCYSFDKASYTIPSGELNDSAVCIIDLQKLRELYGIYNEYVLPVKIASSEGVPVGPSKYSKALFLMNLKNDFSGTYAGNGNMTQVGTSYSVDTQGKRFYAISHEDCYMYAGNMDRTTANHKLFIVNLHFNSDGTIDLTANNPDIDFVAKKGNYNYRFTEYPNDTRKLNRRVAIELEYEYQDITNEYLKPRYLYKATLTMNDVVNKTDFPDAVITVEE